MVLMGLTQGPHLRLPNILPYLPGWPRWGAGRCAKKGALAVPAGAIEAGVLQSRWSR